MLIPQFTQEQDTIIKIIKKTASRAVNCETQRFISESTMPEDWPTLKKHIVKTFLSSDEEVLKQNIEAVCQNSIETCLL